MWLNQLQYGVESHGLNARLGELVTRKLTVNSAVNGYLFSSPGQRPGRAIILSPVAVLAAAALVKC